jgi:methylenetetrahydrofolate dehydrogenase (NADP+)/methenyltetrahydrofolate cyclohydrolase
MSAEILDGKLIAKTIREHIGAEVEGLTSAGKRRPGLGVILVGNNPASQAYVRTKERFAAKCNFLTEQINLPGTCSAQELDAVIDDLNSRHEIDGILLQLPLPHHLDTNHHLERISPEKDADGLHIVNQGKLACGFEDGVLPCTPFGVMRLIDEAMVPSRIEDKSVEVRAQLAGLKAVVVGRSILVGKPVAMLLLGANATVTIAHSRTPELSEIVGEADILVAACGRPRLVQGEWIKPGAVVIDVGINRLDDGSLVGDVDYERAKERAGFITPVPGGVGPMTVAMLMYNTFKLNQKHM